MLVTTTYLEQTSPDELRPAREPAEPLVVARAVEPSPEFTRFLLTAVGGHWHWRTKIDWTWSQWHAWITRPGFETWVGWYDGTPVGYAELLVQLHPYTSAIRDLLLDEDDLRRIFALDGLPDAEPLVLDDSEDEISLVFQSCTRYRRPGTMALLDIYDWTVTVPPSGPATWTSELTDEAISLA